MAKDLNTHHWNLLVETNDQNLLGQDDFYKHDLLNMLYKLNNDDCRFEHMSQNRD